MDTRTSPEIGLIAEAIAKAQGELENIDKAGTNPAFKSKYVKLGDVLDEVRPKFAKYGVAIIQHAINGDGSNVGVATLFAHSSGQWIESRLFVAPAKFDAQGAGSAITYCRRYALMAMAGVAPDDDDGNAAVARPELRPRTDDARQPFDREPANAMPPVNPVEPPEIDQSRAEMRRLLGAFKAAPTVAAVEGLWDVNKAAVASIRKHGGEAALALLHNAAQQRTDALNGGAGL